jgi:hypothetical protein
MVDMRSKRSMSHRSSAMTMERINPELGKAPFQIQHLFQNPEYVAMT